MARMKKTARKASMKYIHACQMAKGTGYSVEGFYSDDPSDSSDSSKSRRLPKGVFPGETSRHPGIPHPDDLPGTSRRPGRNPNPDVLPPYPTPAKKEKIKRAILDEAGSASSYIQEFQEMNRKISPMERNLLRGFQEVILNAEENKGSLGGQMTDLQHDVAYIKTYLGKVMEKLEEEPVVRTREVSEASINLIPKDSIEEDPEEFSEEVAKEPKKDVPKKVKVGIPPTRARPTEENETMERRILSSITQLRVGMDRRFDELRENQIEFQAQVSQDLARIRERLSYLERVSDSN